MDRRGQRFKMAGFSLVEKETQAEVGTILKLPLDFCCAHQFLRYSLSSSGSVRPPVSLKLEANSLLWRGKWRSAIPPGTMHMVNLEQLAPYRNLVGHGVSARFLEQLFNGHPNPKAI